MIKKLVKRALHLVADVAVSPLVFAELAARRLARRDVFFTTHAQLLSLVPGKTGNFVRVAYFHRTLSRCPLDCFIGFRAMFTKSSAELGHRVYVGTGTSIGWASIGDDAMLADGVQVLSGARQHSFDDPLTPYQSQPKTFTKVTIGRNCWIGTGVVVMSDVGDGSIVGACAVVAKPIPPNQIAVGMPAKAVRSVFEEPKAEPRDVAVAPL